MCGIFGVFSSQSINIKDFQLLTEHAKRRGSDSSGLIYEDKDSITVEKADYNITKLLKKSYTSISSSKFSVGHSRLITNGLTDNQPVIIDDELLLIHNGIVINFNDIYKNLNYEPQYKIDSESIIACYKSVRGLPALKIYEFLKQNVKGVFNICLIDLKLDRVLLATNNGSLYYAFDNNGSVFFNSELYPLSKIGLDNVIKLNDIYEFKYSFENNLNANESLSTRDNLIPNLSFDLNKSKLLEYNVDQDLKRCTKCILPETMPFINFDNLGVCNYCNNHVPRNEPKPKQLLLDKLEMYRRSHGDDCIVPFSGGRDSCHSLHLIKNDLGMKPITYTYDWGMVTDLGRRNISLMCSELGVENIIIAANIKKKRDNIRKNVLAWLKHPDLGLINLFTAGDKHFFRYVEDVKKETGISLNLWGVNPLEVTYFKAGFLGFKPDFEETKVYNNGFSKQLDFQLRRFKRMMNGSGYFNSSLIDTLSGEYYRSFHKKSDYYHVYDFYKWNEVEVDSVLDSYGWEKAIDTNTTWRIGDGTAAFYNYIYYTVAGFSEHDTFRSNQIREGDMTRDRALELVLDENRPRYENLKWYLDTINIDFNYAIKQINNMQKLY